MFSDKCFFENNRRLWLYKWTDYCILFYTGFRDTQLCLCLKHCELLGKELQNIQMLLEFKLEPHKLTKLVQMNMVMTKITPFRCFLQSKILSKVIFKSYHWLFFFSIEKKDASQGIIWTSLCKKALCLSALIIKGMSTGSLFRNMKLNKFSL